MEGTTTDTRHCASTKPNVKTSGGKRRIIKAHAELVEKGFMVPLSSFPEKVQQEVRNAPFHHYMPWRAVHNDHSTLTPVRLVMDPTCTGLNEILAKGTNMLPKIPEVLTRFHANQYSWNSDVSKMYCTTSCISSHPLSPFLSSSITPTCPLMSLLTTTS
jgi:hypothetical protein